MDASHQTLLRLYGEPLPVGLPPQPPDEAEFLMLAETKAWMDARPPRTLVPDASALDAIFRAAAHGSPDGEATPGLRHDRAPLARPNRFSRAWTLVASTGALAALGVFAVAIPLRAPSGGAPGTSVTVATAPAPASAAQTPTAEGPTVLALRALAATPVAAPAPTPPAPSAPATASATPAARIGPAPAPRTAPVPAAKSAAAFKPDVDGAIAEAQARAARLRARLDSAAWDAPAIAPSLGAGRGPVAGFSQASHQ